MTMWSPTLKKWSLIYDICSIQLFTFCLHFSNGSLLLIASCEPLWQELQHMTYIKFLTFIHSVVIHIRPTHNDTQQQMRYFTCLVSFCFTIRIRVSDRVRVSVRISNISITRMATELFKNRAYINPIPNRILTLKHFL